MYLSRDSQRLKNAEKALTKYVLQYQERSFKLHPNASRRTKQRWRAHQAGNCNNKCKWCRKWRKEGPRCVCSPRSLVCFGCKCGYIEAERQSVDKLAEPGIMRPRTVFADNPCKEVEMAKDTQCWRITPLSETQPEKLDEMEIIPSAYDVLEEAVAGQYQRAAKRVARAKAEVEINSEALIPGMMVWHRYDHHSCILLEETEDNIWTIQTQLGTREKGVDAAILTPIKPSIFIRAWILLKLMLTGIFYREVEVKTERGFVSRQRFRWWIPVVLFLGTTLALSAAWL